MAHSFWLSPSSDQQERVLGASEARQQLHCKRRERKLHESFDGHLSLKVTQGLVWEGEREGVGEAPPRTDES